MTILPIEKQITLYECVIEISKTLHFSELIKVFYCGTRLKWSTPNATLIVVPGNEENLFYHEMNSEIGCCGSSYLNKPYGPGGPWSSENKHNTFTYKVITDKVYNSLQNDWVKLADKSWQHKNNSFIPGIDITDSVLRFYNLKAFL